jgi:hypothetical protein
MSGVEYRPRFSVEITDEQQHRLNISINAYGLRKSIFAVLLDDLLDLIEEHGQIVIGILLDGQAKPREILPTMAKAERKAINVNP